MVLTISQKVQVSELSKILPNHIEGNSGIVITRWATHGGVTDAMLTPTKCKRENCHSSQWNYR